MYLLKSTILCFIFWIRLSSAFPQNSPLLHDSQQGYDWHGKDSQSHGRGFEGKSDSETIPSTILEEHQEYNVVRYPATKWVCTKMMVDISDDPMKDWRSVFGDDPIAAVNARKKMNTAGGKMYRKLKRYIIGVNSKYVEIKMTKPSTKIRQMVKGDLNMELQTKCIWTGTPWENKELPDPVDESVFIQKRPELDVFVRRFGGWALSQKKWVEEKQELMKSLGSRTEEVDMEYYATVSYQSPWTKDNRRNEVWLVKRNNTEVLEANLETNKVSGGISGHKKESPLESIPYEVLESKENYEVRQYPNTKWICSTGIDFTPSADPMKGWQKKYDSDPLKVTSSSEWKKQASSQMFRKLFKYIQGANSMEKELKMTAPITIKHTPKETDLEEQKMCFWLGSSWDYKQAPQPLEEDAADIEVVQKKGIKVFVRRFGGVAMSHAEWKSQYNQLDADLKEDGVKFLRTGEFFHTSYNSPFVKEIRRNEIWVEVEE